LPAWALTPDFRNFFVDRPSQPKQKSSKKKHKRNTREDEFSIFMVLDKASRPQTGGFF